MEGPAGPQSFTSLTKTSNRPQNIEQTFLRPGMRKVHNSTREQQSGLPEQGGTAGKAGTFPPSCHQLGAFPPSLIPGFAGASPGLLNTKEPAERRRAKLGASRNPLSPWGRGSSLRPAVPSATAVFPPPSPCWTRAEDWSRAPHSPSPTRSRNSTRVQIFQQSRSSSLSYSSLLSPDPAFRQGVPGAPLVSIPRKAESVGSVRPGGSVEARASSPGCVRSATAAGRRFALAPPSP